MSASPGGSTAVDEARVTPGATITTAETRAVMERYLAAPDDDVSTMADDVVFRVMATGVVYRAAPEVVQMFDLYYRTAFDAKAQARAVMVGNGWAVWEGTFVGRHIGLFHGRRHGVPRTGRLGHLASGCRPMIPHRTARLQRHVVRLRLDARILAAPRGHRFADLD